MKKNYLTLLVLLLISGSLLSQSIIPIDKINQSIKAENSFITADLFVESDARNIKIPETIKNNKIYSLNNKSINQLMSQEIEFIRFPIQSPNDKEINLILYQVDLGQFSVIDATTDLPVKYNPGKYFRGIIEGDEKSIVSINIFNNEINGIISSSSENTNYVIGKLEGQEEHIIYEDRDIQTFNKFECGVVDQVYYDREELEFDNNNRALTDCVGLYFEVDYDIFLNKGGITQTTNYVTSLYNEIATLYANENINTNISEIVVWSSTSPYNSNSSGGMLDQFTAYRQGFNGDLAQLLSYQASGGIAYLNTLCNGNPDYRMSFASISGSFNSVPTYSWTVMVCTHEFGHLLGSNHTHACAWNGNNTAIDGCYNTEGNCPQPSIPSGGGTIMSYCHLQSVGINFNLGFGPQPGNVIRSKVSSANCLQACGDDGGGGDNGGGDNCTDNTGTLTINLDNYPNETTWNIKNASGAILYQGGPYSSAGATVNVDLCLLDGCFTFNIYDSWGDGICCGYGNGSYQLTVNGQLEASGGQFGSSNTDEFCINNGNEPTCDDGVQNGNETGIDCGGDCPDCPTCDDGILNNGETEIDCGGPNCQACPTCDDGIQNGNETGIDCGGDCNPCDNPPAGDVELFGSYFESGWDGWTDGGSDCARYNGSFSYEGNYSIRLRDNSGNASSMISPTYDATPFNELVMSFYFYANSMESGEDFFVEVYDGNSYIEVANFASGSDFNNDVFYVVNLTINDASVNFDDAAKIRIRCDASANSDRIFIDGVTLLGVSGNSLPQNKIEIIALNNFVEKDNALIKAYPNPASDIIRLEYRTYEEEKDENESTYKKLDMYNSVGNLVLSQNITSEEDYSIDVSELPEGLYILKINTEEEEISTLKVMVVR